MLRCAISGCKGQEKFLRSGSLQLLDVLTGDEQVVQRMVWFCAECTEKYVVQSWRPAGEQIRDRKAVSSGTTETLPSGMLPAADVARGQKMWHEAA